MIFLSMTNVIVNQVQLVELYERMSARDTPTSKEEAYSVLMNFLYGLNKGFDHRMNVPPVIMEALNLLAPGEE